MPLKRWARWIGARALLLGAALLVILPLAVMVLNAFKTTNEIFTAPLAFPQVFRLDNFITAWDQAHFSTYFANSAIVTGSSVLLILIAASMAAYVLARRTFHGSEVLYLFFMLGLVMPIRLAVVPLLVLLKNIGLLETLPGLVVVYVASGLPFSIFLLTSFLRTLPRELDDAARVDGASEFTVYRRIIVPLSLPSLAVVAIYNVVQVWNDYFLPLVFIHRPELRTIPLGIAVFFGEHQTQWDLIFAGLTMSAIPVIATFVLFGRWFVRGITTGALK